MIVRTRTERNCSDGEVCRSISGPLAQAFGGGGDPHAQAVGGEFEVVGTLELSLLKALGLQPNHTVVDVGCGSGRLASKLAPFSKAEYVGTDILPALLDHARELCGRDDWRFEETTGQSIPVRDEWADFVCFFSVLTHISHEESWHYILESKRVMKPGGTLVCSFLEFAVRSHWDVFRNSYADKAPDKVLNQFLSRDAFAAFAFNCGLEIVSFFDGDKPHIPIEHDVVWEDGRRMSGMANLGQSVCVMRKPLVPKPLPA